jgi:HIV Tat-specific factor 1
VRLFAGNPKGVVSVKFKAEAAAKSCVEKMNGRFFGGRQVAASLWDGFTNYNSVKLEESEEQVAARREEWAKTIDAQEFEEKLRKEQEEAVKLAEMDAEETEMS